MHTNSAGLKQDIINFMQELDDEYVPRWEDWSEANKAVVKPTSPRNAAGQSELNYYTALVDRGKVLMVEMSEEDKVRLDKLYAKLADCAARKRAAREA